MKFYWDSKSLRRDLKVLERKFKEERNPGLKEELGNYIAMIKKQIFYEEVEDEKDEEQECLDNITTEVPAFEMYYPYIKVFKQKLDRFVEMAYYPKKEDARKRFLKKEEIVELVHELFKSTNKEIYEKFCSIYNNRYQTIRFLDKDAGYGRMIFIPGINKPYTSLGNPTSESYRLSLITATHEMSHGVYSLINPRRYTEDDYFFQEIETSFFELIAKDFFRRELDDNGFNDDEKEKLMYEYFEADDCLDYKKLADLRFSLGNPSISDFCDMLEDERLKTCILFPDQDEECSDKVKYLFSYIVAIELYEVYRKDKDLAFSMLREIVNKREDETEYQNITRIVTPNKSLVKYRNRLQKK